MKTDAPELLRRELGRRRGPGAPLGLSGVTDCYQPVERRLQLTRRCLEVMVEFRQPVGAITKSALVARDADLLAELAQQRAADVCLTITTLDERLRARARAAGGHRGRASRRARAAGRTRACRPA